MGLGYLLASLVGVALVVALCALLFAKGRAWLGAAEAEAYLREILPAFAARLTSVATDGRAALCENAVDGAIHLLVSHGDRLVVRKLSAGLVKAVARSDNALSLALADFTLPRLRLSFADADSAGLWAQKLGALP
jgi:hypothetical protein